MKKPKIIRKLDPLGRVVMPITLRKLLDIHENDEMEIFLENDRLVLKKHKPYKACYITKEIKKENKEYAPGLFLSPEGAEILYHQLKPKR
ncbi:AbrB/MazE/SpoVT family DNA-binding domain-containing protein [Planomicrobium sp. CPCC 101079]|uniref:AbrB/MazE/SpoVT family DNA-binding domain-containing protein n=1 Tax=Planomicrobium sp. CPCC 101079 TaxID=2599618 RepID=UPI0011B5135E|nr:AbrB/MazE/SpoVT family DNA-binding domain-containing protein [Planomicrobium sp. CPCC 101079]TWT01854.1 AbrB/MazE/SpoVT family DNA-binding domain-containing protein [Planomicrobium sp. CPCC 101079]